MSASYARCRGVLCGACLLVGLSLTGCQVDIGGQVLPSPYYTSDDVQYFRSGTEFILSQEAAALEARKAEEQGMLEQARRPGFTQPRQY